MQGPNVDGTSEMWWLVSDELAKRVAEHLAPKIAQLVSHGPVASSPWLTTREAIAYTKLPEGTFRKLASSGRIPSHGGRAKLFYSQDESSGVTPRR